MTLSHVHMVGIGGAGMSALARLYLQQGIQVTGSDETASAALDDLRALGATVHVGHAAAHLGDAGLLVYSSAVPATNPELQAATQRGVRAIKHAAALGELFNTRRGIAVAGSHGKTTTTSMIALILERCGLAPSFQVGGELVDLDTSARWGAGPWMVIEADEFDRRFLAYRPEVAVVTNVEPDHFEYYGTVEAMEAAFVEFLRQVDPAGAVIACGTEPRLAVLLDRAFSVEAPHPRVIRYGIYDPSTPASGDWQWVAGEVEQVPGGSRFSIIRASGRPVQAPATLQIPGRHHVLNALAALAAADLAGVPLEDAVQVLATFRGARRRFQLLGEVNGIRVYEDYAHHPTEVRVNLEAARHLLHAGGRLWAVFQPHLHIRTERLFDQFARAFDAADRLVLTDVYSPSGREPAGDYRGSAGLVAAMGHPGAIHIGEPREAESYLLHALRPGDIVLVMGAGPINLLAADLVGALKARLAAGDSRGSPDAR